MQIYIVEAVVVYGAHPSMLLTGYACGDNRIELIEVGEGWLELKQKEYEGCRVEVGDKRFYDSEDFAEEFSPDNSMEDMAVRLQFAATEPNEDELALANEIRYPCASQSIH